MPTLKAEFERMAQVVGSRAGMPGDSSISLARDTGVFYAPSDGYLQIFSGFDSNDKQTMRASITNNGMGVTHWLPITASLATYLPMKKGQEARLSIPDTSASLTFIKTIGTVLGGGLKRLIQKAFCLGGRYGFA